MTNPDLTRRLEELAAHLPSTYPGDRSRQIEWINDTGRLGIEAEIWTPIRWAQALNQLAGNGWDDLTETDLWQIQEMIALALHIELEKRQDRR